jgi:tRNA(fMet)-specific endonuclease VapC
MIYMLDTSIASYIIRGSSALDARLQAPEQSWCISSITRSELRFGIALKPSAQRLALTVNAFLQLAPTLAWDASAADEHGTLRAMLRSKGKPIGDFDEMIAAHALSRSAVLVTDNVKHFAHVPGLRVENWLR